MKNDVSNFNQSPFLNILIAGVGGQGTVLASRLIAMSAIKAGYYARTAETIGMAQRGGCVVSHVRIDSKDKSPLIPLGMADLVIGFEIGEAARNISMLSKYGKMIINTYEIMPVTASLGRYRYDSKGIKEYIINNASDVLFIDGYKLAQKAGSIKAINVLLLGAAVAQKGFAIDSQTVLDTIIENVPSKFKELNKKAFEIGYEYSVVK